MLIKDELGLGARLVVEALQKVDVATQLKKWEEDTNVVKATLGPASDLSTINLVGVTVDPEKRCMISIFSAQDDKSLGQSILDYEQDFKLTEKLNFPVDFEDFLTSHRDMLGDVMHTVVEKLNICAPASDKLPTKAGKAKTENDPSFDKESSVSQRFENSPTFTRPADMPAFEDEYEIQETGNTRGLQERIPVGYGETDLYPTGQKYPNLMDPTASMERPSLPGQGGMIFDPQQEQLRQRQEQERRTRGPGFMPGAKFDDPYGRPGASPFGGSNNSFGFGGGGFI